MSKAGKMDVAQCTVTKELSRPQRLSRHWFEKLELALRPWAKATGSSRAVSKDASPLFAESWHCLRPSSFFTSLLRASLRLY